MGKVEKLLTIKYTECDSINALDKKYHQLVTKTIAFSKNAYAPYSKFAVSAGVLLGNGENYFGTNVENVSFPVGVCAERNIISHVISNYPDQKIEAIAIFGKHIAHQANTFISPCGMCRQAILEAERRQEQKISILLITPNEKIIIFNSSSDLLPLAFEKFGL